MPAASSPWVRQRSRPVEMMEKPARSRALEAAESWVTTSAQSAPASSILITPPIWPWARRRRLMTGVISWGSSCMVRHPSSRSCGEVIVSRSRPRHAMRQAHRTGWWRGTPRPAAGRQRRGNASRWRTSPPPGCPWPVVGRPARGVPAGCAGRAAHAPNATRRARARRPAPRPRRSWPGHGQRGPTGGARRDRGGAGGRRCQARRCPSVDDRSSYPPGYSDDKARPVTLDPLWLRATVSRALDEDLGADPGRDVTTQATVRPDSRGTAHLVARASGVVAGLVVVSEVVAQVADRFGLPPVHVDAKVDDGAAVQPGTVLAVLSGPVQVLLIAERTLLNLVSRASGVATHTRLWADALAGTSVQVLDTRKTSPGLRALEKYAVRCGGGTNKRMGLYDVAMIKDNHVVAAGSVAAAVRALEPELGPVQLEATGNLTLDRAAGVAATGVDYLSVGGLTHSSPILDLALDLLPHRIPACAPHARPIRPPTPSNRPRTCPSR